MIGPSPNPLLLSYLKYAISSQVKHSRLLAFGDETSGELTVVCFGLFSCENNTSFVVMNEYYIYLLSPSTFTSKMRKKLHVMMAGRTCMLQNACGSKILLWSWFCSSHLSGDLNSHQ